MFFRLLKFILTRIIKNKTVIIKYNNEEYLIDNSTEAITLKINKSNFLKKLFYAPSLLLTEGYMDKDYDLFAAFNSNFYSRKQLANFFLYLDQMVDILL